jgi:chitin disaccharide deacetylase
MWAKESSPKVILSADDIGLTASITDGIARYVQKRTLSSVSLIANGYAFDHAIRKIQETRPCFVAVHLNTVECPPVADARDIPDLLDRHGRLHLTFFQTLLKFLFRGKAAREFLRAQFKIEYRAQIRKVQNALGPATPIRVDSHQHLHMIPFLFDTLMDLNREFRFAYVRLPREPFLLSAKLIREWRIYRPSSIIKSLLLRSLAWRNARRIKRHGIPHSDLFLGVMFPGPSRPELTEHLIDLLLSKASNSGSCLEILFHPGRASAAERGLWQRTSLTNYYMSEERDRDGIRLDHAEKRLLNFSALKRGFEHD